MLGPFSKGIWRTRQNSAPVQLEMGPVWDWAEVEAWLRKRHDSQPDGPDDRKAAEAEWYADWLAQQ